MDLITRELKSNILFIDILYIDILYKVLCSSAMVKSGWTKPTKVAADRLDLPNYELLVAVAQRVESNMNDYPKAMIQ